MDTVRMDGFLASVMAAESVKGCRAIMHGPGGCRFHTSRLSSMDIPRKYSIREGPFYFNHPRVPCTYVDEEDYINGADYKVTELLDTIDDAEVCVVIATPGTSLIGDDLNGAACRSTFRGTVIVPEYCHMSEPAHTGYDSVIADIVNAVCVPSKKRKGTVNITGLPVTMHGWTETAKELRGYLEAMGLEVIACVGCGSGIEEIRKSSEAEFCISVMPEYVSRTSDMYERLGIPTVSPDAPVGFDSVRKWIEAAAKVSGKDSSPALAILKETEDRASNIMKASMNTAVMVRCCTYSVRTDDTLALPLVQWLHSYLAMFPVSIRPCPWWDAGYTKRLTEFLEEIGCSEALCRETEDTRADALFTDGYTANLMKKRGICSAGIDMCAPTRHKMKFVQKPVLGAKGAMRILDDLFYGLERF